MAPGVARSRRALLSAAIGGVAAVVAHAVGRPLPAQAADGEPILVGGEYQAESATRISTVLGAGGAFEGIAQSGSGVLGHSDQGPGLRGTSAWGDGVRGEGGDSGAGVHGSSFGGTGVYGSSAEAGSGVLGFSPGGNGVRGVAVSGAGLSGASTSGYALRTDGRLRFDRAAGIATIAAGSRQVMVSPGIDIVGSTFILATLQSTAGGTTGVHRISRDGIANTFTIYLTATAKYRCYIGWMVIG